MTEFIAAIGLLFAIEGLIFAIAPNAAKEAMRSAAETPVDRMRLIGVVSAIAGVLLVWFAKRAF
jgi:hypothetical protein